MRQPIEAVTAATTGGAAETTPGAIRLLGERLELVEELWETVLRSECPPEQVEKLLRLKRCSGPLSPAEIGPEGEGTTLPSGATEAIVAVIRSMDLADGIAAARGFSLYFQLVNILEQHIEEDSYLESLNRTSARANNDPFLPPWRARATRPPFGNCLSGCAPSTCHRPSWKTCWGSSTSSWCSPPTPRRSCAIRCATNNGVWPP